MHSTRTQRNLLAALLLLAPSAAADAHPWPATQFHGANWADTRDNFVDGPIVPSGIDPATPESECQQAAAHIAGQLRELLGINVIRLGINPDTVLDPHYWEKYQAIVEGVRAERLAVILCCWESRSLRDGKIDDPERFHAMWRRVVGDYRDAPDVYFEPFNEPYGYSDQAWRDLAAAWVETYASTIGEPARARILIGGSGYCEQLQHVGQDARLDGCLLSFHLYSWFGRHRDPRAWRTDAQDRIGEENRARTVVTEWGAAMSRRPQDFYAAPLPTGRGQREHAYLTAMSSVIRDWRLGSVYWPGLRDGDPFSMTERSPGDSTLRVTNRSGEAILRRSYGETPSAPSG